MDYLRAFWPIVDPTLGWDDLISEALKDLPWVAARSHVNITGLPRWYVARSVDFPGSGRVTELILVCEVPATRRTPLRLLAGEAAAS